MEALGRPEQVPRRDARTVQNALQSVTTDANRRLQGHLRRPAGIRIRARRDGRRRRQCDPQQEPVRCRHGHDDHAPPAVPSGQPITVEVKGIGYQSYQNSFQLAYDNAYNRLGIVDHDRRLRQGRDSRHRLRGHAHHHARPFRVRRALHEPDQQPVVASRPFPHIPFTVTDGVAVKPTAAEARASLRSRRGRWRRASGPLPTERLSARRRR